MKNADFTDLEDFLQPIPPSEGDNPTNECGKYLKYEYIYDQIKEARREDDPRLTQGIWQIEPKKAAWGDVRKLCESALKNQTKDLQIAMWWLEAMTVLEGFDGLNKGIILLNALCERFWDNIWPSIDSQTGDLTARVAPFFFLSEKISDRIILIPLVCPEDRVSDSFSLSDWITMRHSMHMKDNDADSVLKNFRKSVSVTPLTFFKDLDTCINCISENLRKLDDTLSNFCKENAPSFRHIYEHINDIRQINEKHVGDRAKLEAAEVAQRRQAAAEAAERQRQREQSEYVTINDDLLGDAVSNEDDQSQSPTIEHAYEVLQNIAVFLQKEQPQSPSYILIKIAGEIGKKSFQELMEINSKNGTSIMGTISELYNNVLKIPDQKNFETQREDQEPISFIPNAGSRGGGGIPPGFEF